MDQISPNLPERAIAVSQFDQKLGSYVYVKVDLAIHDDNVGQVDFAKGKPAATQ